MLKPNEIEQLLLNVWRGNITLFRLPLNLYQDTAGQLQTSLFSGFGSTIQALEFESPAFDVLTAMNKNIHVFSAAKDFQSVVDMQKFIIDDQGFIRPFSAFKKDARVIFDTYYDNKTQWLSVERNTAIAQARTAAQWIEIQDTKRDLPLLKYQTVGDERVRPLHASWDNIVRPVDDPFWNTRMPPNDFGCRCLTIQLESGEEPETNLTKKLKEEKKKTGGKVTSLQNDSKLFSMNAGKDQFVFREKGKDAHPYFKVSERFEVLKDNNFNLPLP